MQAQVNANQQIGQITELVFFDGEDQKKHKKKSQGIFQPPIVDIRSSDVRTQPNQ
jgi:hypothetical protein